MNKLNIVEIIKSERHSKYAGKDMTTVQVPSSSGNKFYTVDISNARCSCPGWTMHTPRRPCKHLLALGVTKCTDDEL